MIQILVTFVPSLCWILYRFYQVLRTPVEEIIQDLSIEIPHSPNICIDSVNETSVVIHWDIDRSNDENLYYVIVINGQEVATVTTTSCKLNNLEPRQIYQLNVIVINSITNFKSQSESVFIETFDKQDPKLTFVNDLDDVHQDSLDSTTSTSVLKVKSKSKIRLNEDFDHDTNSVIENLTVEQIQTITNPDVVSDYLTLLQNEVVKINLEYKNQQVLVNKEFDALQHEYQLSKHEYDEETDNKTKKDLNVKSLEKSKDKLTFQKSKLTNQVNALNNSMELLQKKLLEYQDKIHKLQERNDHNLNHEALEIEAINQQISSNQNALENIKVENDSIEENIKLLQIEKRELTSLINQIKPLIDVINAPLPSEDPAVPQSATSITPSVSVSSISHVNPVIAANVNNNSSNNNSTPSSSSPSPAPASISSNNNSIFNKDGSVNKIVIDTLQNLFLIIPQWEDEIMKEIQTYQDLEANWKESFQLAIKKYVSMHQSLQIAKQNKDKNYQPIKVTEYQTSIDFGGFSNALLKPKFGSLGKRNFSPPASLDENSTHINNIDNNIGQIQQQIQQQVQSHLTAKNGLINSAVNLSNGAINNISASNTNNNDLNNFYNHYSQVYTPEPEGNTINSLDQIQGLDQYSNNLDAYQQQQQQQQIQPSISSPQLLLEQQLGLDPYTPFDPMVEATSANTYQSPALSHAPLIQVDTNPLYNQSTMGNGYDNSSLVSLLQQQSSSQLSTNNSINVNQQVSSAPQNQSLGFPYDDSIYTTSIQSPLVETNPSYTNTGFNTGINTSSAANGIYNYNSPILNRTTLTGTPINTTTSANTTNNNLWSSTAVSNISIFGNSGNTATTPNDEFTFINNNVGNGITHSGGELNHGTTGAGGAASFFMTPTSSHTRTVSNNSQIWRNDNNSTLSNHNFNLGGVFGSSNLNLHLPANLTSSSATNPVNQGGQQQQLQQLQQQNQQNQQNQQTNTPPITNATTNTTNNGGNSGLYGNHTPTTSDSNMNYNFGQQL